MFKFLRKFFSTSETPAEYLHEMVLSDALYGIASTR